MCIGKTQCKTRFFMAKIVKMEMLLLEGGRRWELWSQKADCQKGGPRFGAIFGHFGIYLVLFFAAVFQHGFGTVLTPFWLPFGHHFAIIFRLF
jgi:hypothetical protein